LIWDLFFLTDKKDKYSLDTLFSSADLGKQGDFYFKYTCICDVLWTWLMPRCTCTMAL